MFDQPSQAKPGRVVLEAQAGRVGLDQAGRAALDQQPKPSRKHVGEILRQRELRCLAATAKLNEPNSDKKAD